MRVSIYGSQSEHEQKPENMICTPLHVKSHPTQSFMAHNMPFYLVQRVYEMILNTSTHTQIFLTSSYMVQNCAVPWKQLVAKNVLVMFLTDYTDMLVLWVLIAGLQVSQIFIFFLRHQSVHAYNCSCSFDLSRFTEGLLFTGSDNPHHTF